MAVLGSLLASGYASSLTDSLRNVPVPAEALGIARESLGAALQVAGGVGGPAGEAVAMAARTAFVEAMATGTLVAAGVSLLGAVITALFLPGRAGGFDAPQVALDDELAGVVAADTPAWARWRPSIEGRLD